MQHLNLLTILGKMKKNFRQVSPEDFDVEKLLAAAREGRLYVEEHEKGVSEEEIKKEVRAYVARVKAFVTKDFRKSADALWEQLLACDELFELMKPSPKARLCRTFNKYNVVSMIGVLREKGVYEPYSDRKFDALLEPDVAESPYRRYLGAGIEKYALLVKIRQIVGQFRL